MNAMRVLALEARPSDVGLLESVLRARGHELKVCGNPSDFQEAFRASSYALVVIDLVDPTVNGLAMCQRIRSETAGQTPVILGMTEVKDPAYLQLIVDAGVDEYLLKPLEIQLLALRISIFERISEERLRRRYAEDQLRHSLERFELIARGLGEGVWDWESPSAKDDGQDYKIWLSPRFVRLLGYHPNQNVKLSRVWATHVHPDDLNRLTSAFDSHFNLRTTFDVDVRLRVKDGGYRWFRCRGQATWNSVNQPARMVGSLQDITQQRKLEDRLLQVQKMEAIGNLAGGVAHDFNNLLMIMMGRCELLLNRIQDKDPHRSGLNEIQTTANHAALLTRQLLSFGRKSTANPIPLNLNYVVEEMKVMLQRVIGENIELKTDLGEDLGQIKADPGHVWQIILNLAINARDALTGRGSLVIETRNVELDAVFARNRGDVVPGPYVLLAVSDSGCGMDEETQGRIFEPFFTTKEKGQGVGLGLSTVNDIVRQSGGAICVYSELNKGTTFKIYLPLTKNEPRTRAQSPKSLDALKGKETALLVDDNPGVRALIRDIMEEWGYGILEAEDGQHAKRVFVEAKDEIQLLITDLRMPGISGVDLAQDLVRQKTDLRVIYISGLTEGILGHKVEPPGAGLLQKPFTMDVLLSLVRKVLDAP